ncbi:hypothetical protein CVT25_006773 [Psilocybe cyanescens]|uniref:Uncharacterized protein n=1 Tax=Psilocybe cyanescens TaxID=93625 RepID=A0A409X7D0_PSICY|nr:hypothetical protein CVT25_006773 [Psilocybe cyanescens]
MHFSLLVIVCALASSAFAAPVLGGKDKAPAAAKPPPPPANPGDIVMVQSKNFLGPANKESTAPNKPHPAVVVAHDAAHVVSVAPLGHTIPGRFQLLPASQFGIPEHDPSNPSLIDVGPPMQVHQAHLKGLKAPEDLPAGAHPLPAKIRPDHLESLQNHIAANVADRAAASKPEKKQKVEEKAKPGPPPSLPPPQSGPAQQKDKQPAPAQGLYDGLPPPKKAPAAGLYDDLPPPKNQKPADHAGANAPPAAGPSGSKKRPLERRYRNW